MAAVTLLYCPAFDADKKKPNILVIWDDVPGWSDIIACKLDMMGYRRLNIDRIPKKGILFTDYSSGSHKLCRIENLLKMPAMHEKTMVNA
jgi:hypothetical protein